MNWAQNSDSNPNRAFLDYFRCPSWFARFLPGSDASVVKDFSRLRETGRLATIVDNIRPIGVTDDPSCSRDWEVFSPQNYSELVDFLRLERYLPKTRTVSLLHSQYYLLRPLLPLALRRWMQRRIFTQRRNTGFPSWPVDCTVEQIFELQMTAMLQASGAREIPFIWFWPDGGRGAMMMTHDVEKQEGADYCDSLMDLDDSYNIKAAFQLIPEGAYKDFDGLASRIRARGFELNIHDLDHDGRLYAEKALFEKRIGKVNKYGRQHGAKGFRSGSMHRNQEWFNMLEFEYDMSVPTASHLEPQMGGCCTVTPYFVGDILELPLTTVQDHGMFYVLRDRSIKLWRQQIEAILAHNGLISFIVHPDYIKNARHCDQYRELLTYLADLRKTRSMWAALPGEINSWWRERSQMTLEPDGEHWRIAGHGSEPARLAFATLVDGKLRYRMADAKHSTN